MDKSIQFDMTEHKHSQKENNNNNFGLDKLVKELATQPTKCSYSTFNPTLPTFLKLWNPSPSIKKLKIKKPTKCNFRSSLTRL